MSSQLTLKQELFVVEYLKDLNATQAAIRAGYSTTSAAESGCENLKHSKISEAIAVARAGQVERVQIDADFVLKELFKLANVDTTRAFDEQGRLKPIHEIPDEVRRAIAGIEVDELYARGDPTSQIGVTRKVKFWDKTRALEMLGRHLALFKDRLEVSVDPSLVEELKAARERAAWADLA